MIFEWECSTCDNVNHTEMDKWKKVRDGQGFKTSCPNCREIKEIDIEVNVK